MEVRAILSEGYGARGSHDGEECFEGRGDGTCVAEGVDCCGAGVAIFCVRERYCELGVVDRLTMRPSPFLSVSLRFQICWSKLLTKGRLLYEVE